MGDKSRKLVLILMILIVISALFIKTNEENHVDNPCITSFNLPINLKVSKEYKKRTIDISVDDSTATYASFSHPGAKDKTSIKLAYSDCLVKGCLLTALVSTRKKDRVLNEQIWFTKHKYILKNNHSINLSFPSDFITEEAFYDSLMKKAQSNDDSKKSSNK